MLLADKAAFTERFVEEDVRMDSEMKKSLGVLLDIGFSTIMKSDTAGGAELVLERPVGGVVGADATDIDVIRRVDGETRERTREEKAQHNRKTAGDNNG